MPSTKELGINGATKLGLGIILPGSLFVVGHILLLRSVGGKGEDLGFAGMALFFSSFIVIPGVLIGNALIMTRAWRSIGIVLLTGFTLPITALLIECVVLYGR